MSVCRKTYTTTIIKQRHSRAWRQHVVFISSSDDFILPVGTVCAASLTPCPSSLFDWLWGALKMAVHDVHSQSKHLLRPSLCQLHISIYKLSPSALCYHVGVVSSVCFYFTILLHQVLLNTGESALIRDQPRLKSRF